MKAVFVLLAGAVLVLPVFAQTYVAHRKRHGLREKLMPRSFRFKRRFIAISMVSISCVANAANWVTVSTDSNGNAWQIDTESIKISSTSRVEFWKKRAEFWVKIAYKNDQTVGSEGSFGSVRFGNAEYYKYREERLNYVIDCSERTIQNTYWMRYFNDKNVRSSATYDLPKKPDPIIPDSMGDVLFRFVCKK
jgi:hypothetical protein